MTDLLQRIVDIGANAPRTPVEVPEWGVTLYFTPVTGAERVAIRRGINPKDQEELFVSAIQHKATDEAGNQVFDDTVETRAKLMQNADMGVVMRILAESGSEQSPRVQMVEDATSADIRRLLIEVGGARDKDVAKASDGLVEALRRVMKAREHDLAQILGPGPEKGTGIRAEQAEKNV